MYSLTSILSKVTDKNIQRELLCDTIVFPRSKTLIDDNLIFNYHCNGTIDYEQLNIQLNKHAQLLSRGALQDLWIVIKTLQEVHNVLQLNKFDCIQIHSCGLDLMRITNDANSCGRSVYIDINEYSKKCYQYYHPDRSNIKTAIISGVIVALFTSIIPFMLNYKRKS